MIESGSVDVYRYTTSPNTQGILVKSFTFLKTVRGNVQPKTLTEVQAQVFGVNAQNANTKWFGFDNDPQIHELQRGEYNGAVYELRGLNVWPGHSETLLIPLSGVKAKAFCVSGDIEPIEQDNYVWLDSDYWNDDFVWLD